MATDAPITTRGVLVTDEDNRLALIRTLARWMDTAFELPGTKVKFGLDSIIGLIPGLGDLISSAVGGYIIAIASQMGVPRVVILRMLVNLGIDTVVGAVPLVGDLFDVAWKANRMNVALLEKSLADPRAARRGSLWLLAGIVLAVLLLAAGGAALTWYVLSHIAWKS
jgi:hypothetical protein